jgi:hypothetical protein
VSTAAPTHEIVLGERRLEPVAPKLRAAATMAFLVGALTVGLALIWGPFRERIAASYLVGFAFWLSITLGALWFVILQHLVKAGWSVVVRRVAEGMSLVMGIMPVLAIPVAVWVARGDLHAWAKHDDHHGAPAHAPEHGAPAQDDHGAAPAGAPSPVALAAKPDTPPHAVTQAHGRGKAPKFIHPKMQRLKELWLSTPFFLGRLFGYMILWLLMARFFSNLSREQDRTGDPGLTSKMQWWSAPLMIVYAFSTASCAFDLVMSIDPSWYSTMFGVYFFAGCCVGFFATFALLLRYLQGNGLVREVTAEHYHDVGKLLFAFTVFWAYVGFSQFMLIWYGNIPEEVAWFQRRIDNGWIWASGMLILGGFFLPFLALLSRFGKRRPQLLALGAMWLLAMHYLDLMWMVLPEPGKNRSLPTPLLDLGIFLALGGVWLWALTSSLSGVSLIPERDPRLRDSLAHENF